MKKFIITLAFLLVGITMISAQDAAAAKKPQFQWNKKTMTEIGIGEDIQTKINDIKQASNEALKKVKEDVALAEDVKKKTLKDLNTKRQQDIEALLTPEQKAKAEAIKKEMKGKE
jgi:Spy/CpxP family protein refolding chaperone